MVDLPEHAAQVAIWRYFADGCQQFAAQYELNFGTPYLLAYLLARTIAIFTSVSVAVNATVFLCVVAMPLAFRRLLVAAHRDPWLSLLGFPLAFGFSFYWGFLAFLAAMPLAVVFIAVAYEQSEHPTRPRAAMLFVLACLLVTAHALMTLFAAAAVFALAVLSPHRRRLAVMLLAPMAVPLMALLGWTQRMRASVSAVRSDPQWDIGLFRLVHLPSALLAGEWDGAAVAGAFLLVAAVALARPHPSRDPRRWAFAVVAAAGYLFAPQAAFGTVFLYARFAVPLFIALVFALDERASAIGRAFIVLTVVGWMAFLTIRFHRFHNESADFARLVDAMPAARRVLQFNVDAYSDVTPCPVYSHFAGYYQRQKGGTIAWSFAHSFPTVVRYRPGVELLVRGSSFPRDPSRIDWPSVARYDDVIFRSRRDITAVLFSHAPRTFVLRARSGAWWWFENTAATGRKGPCPPLEAR